MFKLSNKAFNNDIILNNVLSFCFDYYTVYYVLPFISKKWYNALKSNHIINNDIHKFNCIKTSMDNTANELAGVDYACIFSKERILCLCFLCFL